MTPQTFFQTIGIGFLLAATVGPISILCIQRTLARGFRYGLVSGVGVALADGSYGLLGGLGFAVINQWLFDIQTPLRLLGGLLLIYIGMGIFRTDPRKEDAAEVKASAGDYTGAAGSIYLLTLSNPLTILTMAAVLAEVSAGSGGVGTGRVGAIAFAASIFLGSLSWWVALTGGVALLRERFSLAMLVWLNRISGALVAGFGLWMFAQAILTLVA